MGECEGVNRWVCGEMGNSSEVHLRARMEADTWGVVTGTGWNICESRV